MQTFLPWPDFYKSAASLDRARLGKQRIEVKQLLTTRVGLSDGWINHPAYKMWEKHPAALAMYGITVTAEWIRRGYEDTTMVFFSEIFTVYGPLRKELTPMPSWLGNEDFHRAHRANLVRKMPEHYVPQFGNLPPEPYIWPVK